MRTTIQIPDQYYNRIKTMIAVNGYTSVNDFILDLIRRKFPVESIIETTVKEVLHPMEETPKTQPEKLSGVEEILKESFQKNSDSIQETQGMTSIGSIMINNCQYTSCTKVALGKYKILLYTEEGEKLREMYLCTEHFKHAAKAGAVEKL